MITETRMSREFSYNGRETSRPKSRNDAGGSPAIFRDAISGYNNGVDHGSGGRGREAAL